MTMIAGTPLFPDQPAPDAGTYRCVICDIEIERSKWQAMPPEDHHSHDSLLPAIARWQLVAAHEILATCERNAEVAAVHPKAMPVILTRADEVEMWLRAPWSDAQSLQRPLHECAANRGAGGETGPARRAGQGRCHSTSY